MNRVEFCADTAVEVTCVEQRDSNPGSSSRFHEHDAHLVWVVVGVAVRSVMEVVELADAGDPRKCHFGVRCGRQVEIRIGGETRSKPVHLVTPRPKRAGATVGAAPQRSVEGMGVSVRHARDGQAQRDVRVRRRRRTGNVNRRYLLTGNRQDDAGLDAFAAEPDMLTPQFGGRRLGLVDAAQDPTRSTNAAIRCTNAAR